MTRLHKALRRLTPILERRGVTLELALCQNTGARIPQLFGAENQCEVEATDRRDVIAQALRNCVRRESGGVMNDVPPYVT